MYSTFDVTFYCDGDADEALPRFQAMLDDVVELLRERHPGITTPAADESLTPDDVNVGLESQDE